MTFTEEETIELAKLIGQHKVSHDHMKTDCLPSCFKKNLKDAVNFVVGKRELTTTTGLMTDEEHRAMEMSAQLWNYINKHVVIAGHTRDSDLREIMFHIHGIQRALLGQAAARAYPDQYRLLGGRIAGEGDEMPAAPWVDVDALRAKAMDSVEKTYREQSEDRRTDEDPQPKDIFSPEYTAWFKRHYDVADEQSEDQRADEVLGHSCSCHVRGVRCDVCASLNCPVAEERISHILTLVTNQPICMTPRSEIGFVKAVTGDVDARACKACIAAIDELGFRTMEA